MHPAVRTPEGVEDGAEGQPEGREGHSLAPGVSEQGSLSSNGACDNGTPMQATDEETATARNRRTFRALKARLRDSTVSAEARLLWLTIDSFANRDGTNAHPSVDTLGALLGKGRKWVQRYLRELRALKWLEIGRLATSDGWVNSYILSYPEESKGVGSKKSLTGRVQKGPTTKYQDTKCVKRSRKRLKISCVGPFFRSGTEP